MAADQGERNTVSEAITAHLESSHQYGVRWEETIWGLEPRWNAEPNLSGIETLSRQHLGLTEDARCTIRPHVHGGFHKIYTVETDSGKSIMRVALPLDPQRKTQSEVATMEFARCEIGMPVPKVLAYCASNRNAIGYEWILMEYMHGRSLEDSWRTMPWTKKVALVKQMATYHSTLYAKKFRAIGNLYPEGKAGLYIMDSVIAPTTFWSSRRSEDVPRGPFRDSHEWLSTRLRLLLSDQNEIIRTTDDEDDLESAKIAKSFAEQLIAILPEIFSPGEVETTIIFHDDIHEKNLIVDENGDLTAILNWECISALPLWKACQPPAYLEGRIRDKKPQRENYGPYNPEVDHGGAELNQNMTPLYWDALLEYERGHLREVYLSEMSRLQPDWILTYRIEALKRDFDLAVAWADCEILFRRVQAWLQHYKRGERTSLIHEPLG